MGFMKAHQPKYWTAQEIVKLMDRYHYSKGQVAAAMGMSVCSLNRLIEKFPSLHKFKPTPKRGSAHVGATK